MVELSIFNVFNQFTHTYIHISSRRVNFLVNCANHEPCSTLQVCSHYADFNGKPLSENTQEKFVESDENIFQKSMAVDVAFEPEWVTTWTRNDAVKHVVRLNFVFVKLIAWECT